MGQLVDAFEKARTADGKPTVILADTVKGKGVSFMENQPGWHGKTPNREELTAALKELGLSERIPVERLLDKAKSYQAEVDRKLASQNAPVLARLLVELRRRHESQDGAHAQGFRPVAGGERRR